MTSFEHLYSDLARTALEQSFPFPEPKVPVRFNFDQGTPAPELYPLKEFKHYLTRAIDEHGADTCEYFGAAGYEEMQYGYAPLRATIAERIGRRDGRAFTRQNVMLTFGSVHALSLTAHAFLGAGDGAVVESLSFPYMVDYMGRTGASVATVPVDEQGMDVEAVPGALKTLRDAGLTPKMIYAIPSYQVPSGTLMPLERRRRLVEIAQEWNVLLVEDNCYHELYFEQPPPPTMLSMDTSGLVLQTDTFSKILAPGLRTGWALGAPQVLATLAAVREDLGTSQLIAHMLDLYLNAGELEPRLKMLRPLYKRKRDLALAALREHCGDNVKYVIPEGGIYFWLEVNDGIDCAQVSERIGQQGVACRPGERFTDDPKGRQFIRMAFLHVSEEEIEQGIKVLGEALAASTSRADA
ncbi:MAG: PLP-dependent aminotransferase family protein [Acidimicrobiia bacterium]|nr:PLP-dependent aminotransferase family protein [Acidimicrobiia bacterium]